MKKPEFLKESSEPNPAPQEQNPGSAGGAGPKLLRRIAIAAAAVLLLAGTVYAVARGIEMRRTGQPAEAEEGFEAKTELPLVQWSSFKGEIRNAGEAIVKQYQEYVPEPVWSNYLGDPGGYTRRFDRIEEAVNYIGLRELKTPGFPLDSYDCSVTAHGDEEGRVDRVTLYAERIRRNDIGAQETVTILTEHAQGSEYASGGVWTDEFPRNVEFLRYVTPGGNECRIAVLKPEYDSGFLGLTCYAAAGPAFYELHLGAVPKEKYELSLDMLSQWADALD